MLIASRKPALLLISLCVAAAGALVGAPGIAAPGDLDPTWGGGQGWSYAPGGVARQPAYGDVDVVPVTGGFWTVGVRGDGTKRVLRLVRHQPDGSDPAVGAVQVVHEVGLIGDASAATPDGAGGAYVVLSRPVGTDWAPLLVHVNADRTLDATFGEKVLQSAPSVINHLEIARDPGGTLTVLVQHDDIFTIAVTPMRALADGTLDPTFGTGGVGVSQTIAPEDEGYVGGMLLGPDRSVYVTSSRTPQLSVSKWTPSGTPDASYGAGGTATFTIPGSSSAYASPRPTIDSSGRVLVPYRDYTSGSQRARIARVLATGTVDPGFGTGGATTYDNPAGWALSEPMGTATLPDGSVAAVWYVDPTGVALPRLVTILFSPLGAYISSVDEIVCATRPQDVAVIYPNFASAANSGAAETWCTDTAAVERSFSNAGSRLPVSRGDMVVTPSGRILVVPEIYEDTTTTDIGVLTPNGQPDPAYGSAGFVDTAFGAGADFPYQSTSPGPGGTFYVRHGLMVGRFNAAGALDPGFSGDGLVTPPGFVKGYSVLSLRDGGALVAGQTAGFPLRIVKYTPDGSLDPAFDGDGIWESSIPAGSAKPVGQALDGSTVWSLGSAVDKVIRVLPGGGQDMSFGTGGQITITANGASLDRQDRVLIASNGDGIVRVRRYSPSGQPDTGFGAGGIAAVEPPAGLDQNAYTLTSWPDGSMVVGLVRYPDGGGGVRLAWSILDPSGQVVHTRATGLGHSYAPAAALPDGRVVTLTTDDQLSRVFAFKGLAPATPTLSAVATGPSTATLTATGTGAGLTGVTLGSEFGPSAGYGSRDQQAVPETLGAHQVVRNLSGLSPATTYHARAVLTNASGTTEGVDVTFTTLAAGAPVVSPPLSRNPTVTITLPKKSKRTSIRAWRVLKGTAAPAAATPTVKVAKVQINLVRTITKKKCAFYTGKAWRTTTCKKAVKKWVKVKGTTTWKLKIKGLRLGKYTVRAKARDTAGANSVAVAGINRFRFRLKRP